MVDVEVNLSELDCLLQRIGEAQGVPVPAELEDKFRKDLRWAIAPFRSMDDAHSSFQIKEQGRVAALTLSFNRLLAVARNHVTFFLEDCQPGSTAYLKIEDGRCRLLIRGREGCPEDGFIKLV